MKKNSLNQSVKLFLLCLPILVGLTASVWSTLQLSIGPDESSTIMHLTNSETDPWPTQPKSIAPYKERFQTAVPISMLMENVRTKDVQPPLYFLTLHYWVKTFGISLLSIRFFSLFLHAALLLILLHYAFRARPIVDWWPYLAAVTYSGSAAGLYFAIFSRNYVMTLAWLALGLILLLREAEGTRKGVSWTSICFGGLALGFAFTTHYLALFPAGFLALWFLFTYWKHSKLGAALPLILFPLSGLTSIPFLKVQLFSRPTQSAGFPGAGESTRALVVQLPDLIFPASVWGAAAWGFILVVAVGAIFNLKAGRNKNALVLSMGLLATPLLVLLTLNVAFDKMLVQPRYVGFSSLGLCLLLGAGLQGWLTFSKRVGVALTLVLIGWSTLANLSIVFGDYSKRARDLRKPVARLCGSPDAQKLLIIDEGTSQSNPSRWIYEVTCPLDVAVLRDVDQLSDLPRVPEIWLARANQEFMADSLERYAKFAEKLAELGYTREDNEDVLLTQWRRQDER